MTETILLNRHGLCRKYEARKGIIPNPYYLVTGQYAGLAEDMPSEADPVVIPDLLCSSPYLREQYYLSLIFSLKKIPSHPSFLLSLSSFFTFVI